MCHTQQSLGLPPGSAQEGGALEDRLWSQGLNLGPLDTNMRLTHCPISLTLNFILKALQGI